MATTNKQGLSSDDFFDDSHLERLDPEGCTPHSPTRLQISPFLAVVTLQSSSIKSPAFTQHRHCSTETPMYTNGHIDTHTHTHTRTRTRTHRQKYTHTRTHVSIHTHTRTHIYTHTHKNTHKLTLGPKQTVGEARSGGGGGGGGGGRGCGGGWTRAAARARGPGVWQGVSSHGLAVHSVFTQPWLAILRQWKCIFKLCVCVCVCVCVYSCVLVHCVW